MGWQIKFRSPHLPDYHCEVAETELHFIANTAISAREAMVLIRVLIYTGMTEGSDIHNEYKTLYLADGNNLQHTLQLFKTR